MSVADLLFHSIQAHWQLLPQSNLSGHAVQQFSKVCLVGKEVLGHVTMLLTQVDLCPAYSHMRPAPFCCGVSVNR